MRVQHGHAPPHSIKTHPPPPGLDRAAQFLALQPLFLADPVEPAFGAFFGEVLGFGDEIQQSLAGVGAVGFLGARDNLSIIYIIIKYIIRMLTFRYRAFIP